VCVYGYLRTARSIRPSVRPSVSQSDWCAVDNTHCERFQANANSTAVIVNRISLLFLNEAAIEFMKGGGGGELEEKTGFND